MADTSLSQVHIVSNNIQTLIMDNNNKQTQSPKTQLIVFKDDGTLEYFNGCKAGMNVTNRNLFVRTNNESK